MEPRITSKISERTQVVHQAARAFVKSAFLSDAILLGNPGVIAVACLLLAARKCEVELSVGDCVVNTALHARIAELERLIEAPDVAIVMEQVKSCNAKLAAWKEFNGRVKKEEPS